MERPLNIHPDIWKIRQVNNQKNQSPSKKSIELDKLTVLCNSIDMIIEGIYKFKKEYEIANLNQYSQKQIAIFQNVNNLVDKALIPYSIDIVKELKKLQNGEINE